jgi:outer membrane protein
MGKQKPLLLLFLTPFFLIRTSFAQDKWDLRRCVDYAVANNISVKQADVQARLAKLSLDQAKWLQIPTLGLGSQIGVKSGNTQNPNTFTLSTQTYALNNFQVQSSVVAYNFSSIQNLIQAQKFAWLAALANSDKTKNDITLNVANAYLQVLLVMEQTEIAQSQLRLSQDQLALTRKQVNAGTLPELNAAELESQVAQDSATYINSKGNIQLNILTLKAYMGLQAGAPFDVYAPPVEDIPVENIADLQPEMVYTLALVHQPLQKMDSMNIESARKNVASNRGAMYPTFSVVGSLGSSWISNFQLPDKTKPPVYTGTDTSNILHIPSSTYVITQDNYTLPVKSFNYFNQLNTTFNQFIGLNINIPILNNRQLRTAYDKSKLTLQNQQLQRDQDNLTLKQTIYEAYTAATVALQKFEANKITVAASEKSYQFADKRHQVGMLNTVDLLIQKNNLANAEVNLISSQFDYVFKMKVLEFYKGLGVKLTKGEK